MFSPDGQQAVLHYAALPLQPEGMDEQGRMCSGADPASRLRLWLNELRATLPRGCEDGPLYPELTLICRTRAGGAMAGHTDFPWRTLSAIVYLNEEFEGGLTRFADGAEVKPETGKAVLFRGKDFWHEVTDVAGGARYTVSLWWSNDPRRLEP